MSKNIVIVSLCLCVSGLIDSVYGNRTIGKYIINLLVFIIELYE
jgi:hypothetical protein